ncbi:octopine dehydrogenase [Sporosarcina sp. NCCP-2716]|uniref:NAD/NADP-dependent octopine/nopaline dehydrogenase family protein n=1 Tax=Sporosarcina sp. NCCP-2716 TaxID=2943679 RepID=UPI00203A6890|nr:NAD/NADP-dependent octopine/nopaline dehydrogenase family protein [Sporosarcina sp. NCCP-2716]GKV69056.1 octopine dehydrogenase [Sporosarcina sp. NCCP-2716]
MKITIVGSGHGGSTAAACLARDGHEVSMLKLSGQPDEHFQKLEETKEITLHDEDTTQTVPLHTVTRDPADVIPQADILLIYYVSNYHKSLASALAPHLQKHQTVYICPGYLGSVFFLNELERLGRSDHAPLFVEGETLPYSCRITAPGEVTLYSENYGHPIASLPSDRIDEACETLKPILGNCIPRENIAEVALHNPNLIMHTVGIALNAAYIENSDGQFSMYTEGFTPSTWKVANELDQEKMDMLERIGCTPRSYIEEFKVRTFTDPESYSDDDAFGIYADSVKDLRTKSVNNRYITEDVPMGLGLLHSLGEHLGMPTPVGDSIITLAGTMVGDDYFKEARSVEALGFESAEDLLSFISHEKKAHA